MRTDGSTTALQLARPPAMQDYGARLVHALAYSARPTLHAETFLGWVMRSVHTCTCGHADVLVARRAPLACCKHCLMRLASCIVQASRCAAIHLGHLQAACCSDARCRRRRSVLSIVKLSFCNRQGEWRPLSLLAGRGYQSNLQLVEARAQRGDERTAACVQLVLHCESGRDRRAQINTRRFVHY